MSNWPGDYNIELIQASPTAAAAPPPIDLSAPMRAVLGGFGSINRVVDRTLLNFKTGDLTVVFDDWDGTVAQLFAGLGPTDRWTLRVKRRGALQFTGVVLGQGSVRRVRLERHVEVTAYGPPKILDDASAEAVSRTFGVITVTTATAGQSTLTISSTAGMASGDILHLTDQINSEDVTVKQVTTSTVVSLETSLVNPYAAGSQVTVKTPFYRFKSIPFLVSELFKAASIGMADLRLSLSQFRRLAPTLVNLGGDLDLTGDLVCSPGQRNGRRYQLMKFGAGGAATGKMDYQATPDVAWIQEDATPKPWVDFSRYYLETDPEPAIILRANTVPETDRSVNGFGLGWDMHQSGWDYKSATKVQYAVSDNGAGTTQLSKVTSADGVAWSAKIVIATLPDNPGSADPSFGVEFDQVRNAVYCSYPGATAGQFQYYDINAAIFTSLKQADDVAATRYFGPCYIPELDILICLRQGAGTAKGPTFEICAFRGLNRLWKRPFPNCTVAADRTISSYVYPTQTARSIQGAVYMAALADASINLVWSSDQFLTNVIKKLSATTRGSYFAARINGQYTVACYSATSPRTHLVAAPFYAGVVAYADHSGLSVAQALNHLAVLTNAVAWVDDDVQGHFVARDLLPGDPPFDAAPRLRERNDLAIWDQTYQYVTVSGGSISVTSGLKAFASKGITISSALLPNEAFAQALADQYYAFYSQKRALVEAVLHDIDGHIYRPLDRLTIGEATRYLVYESNHHLPSDEVTLELLEDV